MKHARMASIKAPLPAQTRVNYKVDSHAPDSPAGKQTIYRRAGRNRYRRRRLVPSFSFYNPIIGERRQCPVRKERLDARTRYGTLLRRFFVANVPARCISMRLMQKRNRRKSRVEYGHDMGFRWRGVGWRRGCCVS